MSATPDPSIRVERKVRLLLLALSLLLSACAEGPTPAPTANPPARRASPVEHLIIIGFDNTHWQDDLQKMPHLLAFFKNGAVLRNSHTGLVSHTATAFLSIITGQYAEKTGILNNTFFDGGKAASWGFWESETDAGHRLVTTPGPWQAFNQAGLDVGVVGWGDMVLENDREVSKFSSLNNREARAAKDYLGFAVYHKDGTRELGSPNIPWLYEVVGSFPGWARLDPSYALKATYAMQARGVPVTITYIENLHDSQPRGGYDSALAAADKAFDEFFKRLAAIGITPANTLFVFTTDEEDTYIAGGVKTLSLQAWLADNPTFKLPASEMLTAGDASLLAYLKDEATLPRVLEALKDVPAWEAIVTRSAMKLLHMASADADRVPSFVLFARPDVAYATYSDPNRLGGGKALQPNPRYLWNHGTLAPEITTVWLAMVGPGVQAGEFPLWADHTDIRPTIHHLMNLPPVTEPDGRVLFEALTASALPAPLNAAKADLSKLADAYKQINAPLGRLGQAALKVSTRSALAATKPEGRQLDSLLLKTAADRDALAAQMTGLLNQALSGKAVDAEAIQRLVQQAESLIATLAPDPSPN